MPDQTDSPLPTPPIPGSAPVFPTPGPSASAFPPPSGVAASSASPRPAPAVAPTALPPAAAPVKYKLSKINWKETQELIGLLSQKIGTPVIVYFTPPGVSINQNHPDLFIDHLRKIGPQEALSLILVSNGGDGTASLRIATILREYCKNLYIYVPSRCASAATMLALSADRIVMSYAGYLTAIDSSLTHPLNPKGPDNKPVSVSTDQINRLLGFLDEEGSVRTEEGEEGPYRTLFKHIHPVVIGEVSRGSSSSELIANKMMKMHAYSFEDEGKIASIAGHLVNDYPQHAFPILYQEAREIGLPVEKATLELSEMMGDLVKLYDSTTLPAVTNIRPDFYHWEEFTTTIESSRRRTTYRNSFDKRFNPVTKMWFIENDNTRWVNIHPSKTPDVPFKMTSLDVGNVEEGSVAPIPAVVPSVPSPLPVAPDASPPSGSE